MQSQQETSFVRWMKMRLGSFRSHHHRFPTFSQNKIKICRSASLWLARNNFFCVGLYNAVTAGKHSAVSDAHIVKLTLAATKQNNKSPESKGKFVPWSNGLASEETKTATKMSPFVANILLKETRLSLKMVYVLICHWTLMPVWLIRIDILKCSKLAVMDWRLNSFHAGSSVLENQAAPGTYSTYVSTNYASIGACGAAE